MTSLPQDTFILVVDDHPDVAFLLKRLLKRAGIEKRIEEVSDAETAIAFLQEQIDRGFSDKPLFVLLDINMPRANGFEVLRWIRSQPALKNLVVIMLSTSTEEFDIKRAHELGADAYLVKNPDPQVLAHVYAAAMEIRSRGASRGDSGHLFGRYGFSQKKTDQRPGG